MTFPRMRIERRAGSTTIGAMVGCSGLSTMREPSRKNRFTVASPSPPDSDSTVGERQRRRGPAHARPWLQLALALEGPEMIERSAGGDLEALAELAHGRRDAVLGLEAPHETQHFPLSVRQLSHGRSPDPEV